MKLEDIYHDLNELEYEIRQLSNAEANAAIRDIREEANERN